MLLCGLQGIYALLFIWRSSVVVTRQRYFCLFDDALISMRYARHLAEGHGLVWKIGEHVEGFSNLAWTLVMALLHLPGLGPSHTCLLTQLLGIPMLWCCVWATYRLCNAFRLLPRPALIAIVLCVTYYNLLYFSLMGMETAALCFVVTMALASAVWALRERRGRLAPYVWFMWAVLLHADAVLLTCWTASWMLLRVRQQRWRPVVGLALVSVTLGLQAWWRRVYYGDWMPNTYYLKMTGWPLADRLLAGVDNSAISLLTMAVPLGLSLWALLGRRRRIAAFLIGAFCLSFAFQVYVGGDAWPLNRFLIPTTPALFVAAAAGIRGIVRDMLPRRHGGRLPLGVLAAVCLLAINGIHWDHIVLLAQPQMVGDNAMNVRLWKAIERVADDDACIGVGYAGLLPYFSDRNCVDLLGKCERHVARTTARADSYLPGHNKRDTPYILATYRPDILIHYESAGVRPDYFPVTVDVDGIEQIFLVHHRTSHVHGGRRLRWSDRAEFVTLPLSP
ncbi:MAG: hypothetical protein PVJ57_17130 [Phycisphaerae bacterium]